MVEKNVIFTNIFMTLGPAQGIILSQLPAFKVPSSPNYIQLSVHSLHKSVLKKFAKSDPGQWKHNLARG